MIKGSSGSSYGIEVAKLAGIPDNVVTRAQHYIKKPVVTSHVESIESVSVSPRRALVLD